MEIVYDDEMLAGFLDRATEINPDHPVLVDRFLDDAIEIDVDALYDGADLFLGGVMEHIEEAGIHSGDSACALPPITLGHAEIERIRQSTRAHRRRRRGPRTAERAVRAGRRRAVRARGQPARVAHGAVRVQGDRGAAGQGRGPRDDGRVDRRTARRGDPAGSGDGGTLPIGGPIAVKEAVLPFGRFHGVDTVLGPEMRSTGEVMGIDASFGTAFAKSQSGAYAGRTAHRGRALVSVANRDKRSMIFPVKRLADLGFEIVATAGTAEILRRNGLKVSVVRKHREGPGPDGEPHHDPGDHRRRRRPDREHAVRGGDPARRVRDPHRRRHPVGPVHHHDRGSGGRGAGDRGPARRRDRGPFAAGARCRPGPGCADARRPGDRGSRSGTPRCWPNGAAGATRRGHGRRRSGGRDRAEPGITRRSPWAGPRRRMLLRRQLWIAEHVRGGPARRHARARCATRRSGGALAGGRRRSSAITGHHRSARTAVLVCPGTRRSACWSGRGRERRAGAGWRPSWRSAAAGSDCVSRRRRVRPAGPPSASPPQSRAR